MAMSNILQVIFSFLSNNTQLAWNYFIHHEVCWIILAVIIILVVVQRRNKNIRVHCSDHEFNRTMLGTLQGLIRGYTPTFWLPFSVMKGLYQGDRKIPSIDIYHRVECPMEDGEVLAIDFYPKELGDVAEDKPIIMFVPGVFGMSNDVYAAKFCRMIHETNGWRSCVFNRRGYGGMPIKGSRVVGFTSYDDIHEIVKQLAQMYPKASIYLAGCSMGAANIQNYLANYSEENLVKAACTVSCPWNAHIVTEKVRRNPLLRKGIHNYQIKLFKEQLNNESFQKLLQERQICTNEVLKTTDNCHFDEVCATAGLGLESREQYYEALSTHNKIGRINVPVLSINSSDDLLIPPSVVPFEDIERNPYFLHLQVTGGGHTEYFHGCKADYWAYMCALEYFRQIETMLADGNDLLAISKLAVNEVNVVSSEDDLDTSKPTRSPKMSNMRPEHFRFVEPLSDA